MITGHKITLRSKNLADARNSYAWQTDPELARMDAISPLDMAFAQYLSEYTFELYSPSTNRQEFAIETMDDEYIGNCVYYGINGAKGEAELGIMIGNRDYWDDGYGADAVSTLLNHIFSQTNLQRIYLKTLDWNTRAHKCFRKCGFARYGHMTKDGFNFLLMELHRKQWQAQSAEERQPPP